MARVLSIVNQKGGVGKTTTSINLAACLAESGQRVLLIDVDAQGNATSGFGIDPRGVEHSTYTVLTGDAPINKSIVTTAVPKLHLLPSSVDLAGAAVELVEMERREFRLRDAVAQMVPHYDFIIIDCPPALGLLTINGIVASDEVLIPVQAEYYALEGLGQLLQTIQLVQEHLHAELSVLGVVLTMYDKRNRLSEAVQQDIVAHSPHRVFETIIPRNVRLAEAPSFAKTIIEYDPASRGAQAYRELAAEVMLTLPPTMLESNPESDGEAEQEAEAGTVEEQAQDEELSNQTFNQPSNRYV